MFKVQVRGGDGNILEFIFNKDSISLGRDPEVDVFIPSPLASRRHAVIYRRAGKTFVEDKDSSNGTHIRQERISLPTEISANDPIKIGDIFVRIDYQEEEKKSEDNSDPGYSLAQRLGNRRATVHLNGAEMQKILGSLPEEVKPQTKK